MRPLQNSESLKAGSMRRLVIEEITKICFFGTFTKYFSPGRAIFEICNMVVQCKDVYLEKLFEGKPILRQTKIQ